MKDAKVRRAAAAEAKARKPEAKRKPLSVKENPKKRQSKAKTPKDPNLPKRPATAFFVFLEEFRKTFKEKNPNVKGVAAVGKACGDKWKEMSQDEKAPYIAKAAEKKAEYDISMVAYKRKQVKQEVADGADSHEESEKSKSDLHEDEEEGDSQDDDDDEDEDDD